MIERQILNVSADDSNKLTIDLGQDDLSFGRLPLADSWSFVLADTLRAIMTRHGEVVAIDALVIALTNLDLPDESDIRLPLRGVLEGLGLSTALFPEDDL